MNKVMLIGNVGRDPENRATQTGTRIASFSIATNERWRDKVSGEMREKTEWHNIVCFNEGLNNGVMQYVRKGGKIYVSGKMQTRKWTDQSGQERSTTEVVIPQFGGEIELLGGGQSNGHARSDEYYPEETGSARRAQPARPAPAAQGRMPLRDELDDDIPF